MSLTLLLQDFALTLILAIFWLSGSAAWSNGTSALKNSLDPSIIHDKCQYNCNVNVTGFSGLNISLVSIYLLPFSFLKKSMDGLKTLNGTWKDPLSMLRKKAKQVKNWFFCLLLTLLYFLRLLMMFLRKFSIGCVSSSKRSSIYKVV